MAVLYATKDLLIGWSTPIVGYQLFEGLENSGEILVQQSILSDFNSTYSGPEEFYLAALYAPVSFINSFNPEVVRSFDGIPEPRKFGSLVFNHLGCFGGREYITYEKQAYPIKETIVNNALVDFPSTMSALPPIALYDQILRATGYASGWSGWHYSGYLNAQKFNYHLEKTVNATIGFFYVCYVVTIGEDGGTTYFVVAV